MDRSGSVRGVERIGAGRHLGTVGRGVAVAVGEAGERAEVGLLGVPEAVAKQGYLVARETVPLRGIAGDMGVIRLTPPAAGQDL